MAVRGRPRKFDPDVALGRAAERFRAQGFAGTSLDDLSEATGLARPSLAAAFGDKRALYLATIDRVAAQIEERLVTLAKAKLPLADALARLMLGAISLYFAGDGDAQGCLIINTAATSAATDPDVRERLAAFVAMQDARIADVIAATGAQDADEIAQIVSSIVHSCSVRARSGVPREALEAMARQMAKRIASSHA